MKMKSNKGITLVALIITIIIMIIIASIAVYSGSEAVTRAKLESKKTNMLLIEAQAKKYVEEVNYRLGVKPENMPEEQKNSIRTEIYETQGKLQKTKDAGILIEGGLDENNCYYVTREALENMGLKQVYDDKDKYYVCFDEINAKVEVYSTAGFEGRHSLTDIETIKL